VLVQDEITASAAIEWRMHTNATVTTSGTTATLQIDDKTLTMTILNAPAGAVFSTTTATRYASDPPTPAGSPDQPNPGVTVVVIDLPAGTYSLQVLFTPQWPGVGSFQQPPSVPLDSWSLTSHG
jgi:hypothetical protein